MESITYKVNQFGEIVLIKNGYHPDLRTERDDEGRYTQELEGSWELKEEES